MDRANVGFAGFHRDLQLYDKQVTFDLLQAQVAGEDPVF